MKRLLFALAVVASIGMTSTASATPSTTFWTPATTYVQPYLLPHLTYDTYFAEQGAYPILTGLEIGVLPFEKLQAEIGFDLQYPGFLGKSAALLNAKLALPEGAYGEWSPGISGGIYNLGFQNHVTTQDILHAEIGKTTPFGSLTVGGYLGLDKKAFLDENGAPTDRAGFIGAYVTPDWVTNLPGLNKVNAFADVQTGKSAFGAVGTGVGFYFTPTIDLLAGPVFFLNDKVQPGGRSWLWSMQIDVDFDVFKKAAPATPAPAPVVPQVKP
jgi:hypothetical protein